MPISVRFSIRKGYNTLHCRLLLDAVQGPYFSPVRKSEIPKGRKLKFPKPIHVGGTWNQDKQVRTDRGMDAITFNARLRKIQDDIEHIYHGQVLDGLNPTPESVQYEYYHNEREVIVPDLSHTLFASYQSHVVQLTEQGELDPATIAKWKYGEVYLSKYLKETNQDGVAVTHVGIGWAKEYHLWLTKKKMAPDSATRYVRRVSEAIDHYIYRMNPVEQRTAFNPLQGHKFSRAKTKDVYFLEKPHLEKFWKLDNRGHAGRCIWWMGVIFLTGLDYPDAVRYVQNRATYERQGPSRKYIEINRSKPPKSMCKIPMWPELVAILEHVPAGEPPTGEQINDYMKGVEVLIGFPHRLTCKIGRKTAGYIFLLRGYSIKAVSRILGQSSVAITERHYVKVTGELVEQEDEKLT